MVIEYVGHACFYLTNKNDVRIIIDPYDNTIGLIPVSKEADIALLTHDHYDHNYLDGVHGNYDLIKTPGAHLVRGVKITGTELPHDASGGAERGMVVAYTIETDGMRILHMGDIGIIPPESFFEAAGKIDVLMIPVGGTYTIDAVQAHEIMNRLAPNITIPMHYKTTHLNLDIAPLHGFVTEIKKEYDISRLGSSKFEITADNLKKRDRVLLMENSF